jgi:Protein of unknown function (DUF4238)
MAEKKKQHYVPRFYLKYFSNGSNGTHIGIFHKKDKRYIKAGELKNQAYETYYYGKDGELENKFSEIEALASKIIDKINNTNILPPKSSNDYKNLYLFAFIQLFRTKQAANEMQQMLNTFKQGFSKDSPEFEELFNKYEFTLKEPTASILESVLPSLSLGFDLECKLIINTTNIPFISSDHPVVRYNRFLERKNFQAGRLGIANKGLQVFYPISPKLLILYYDKRVYKIGFKKRNVINIANSMDVFKMNLLQFLNSNELVFFNDAAREDYINSLNVKSLSLNSIDRNVINEFPEEPLQNGTVSQIYHYFRKDLNAKMDLSFIKETDHAKAYKLTGYGVELRNENLRRYVI